MIVQELIDKLMLVKDKNKPIVSSELDPLDDFEIDIDIKEEEDRVRLEEFEA